MKSKKRYVIVCCLLALLILVGCADESETTEGKIDKKTEVEKDVTDEEAVYEFFSTLNPNVTRKDYDENWDKLYLDATDDGTEEVVILNKAGMIEDVFIIDIQDNKFINIVSNMKTTKSDDHITVDEGFVIISQTSGGGGAYYDYMNLYKYKDGEFKVVLNLMVGAVVSSPETNYEIKSTIDGTLTDFIIIFTKEENDDIRVIEKSRYKYNDSNLTFEVENLSIENEGSKMKSIDISELQDDMKLNGGIIKDYYYRENDSFSFRIDGESELSGWIYYDEFSEGLAMSSEKKFTTKIVLSEFKTLEGFDYIVFGNSSKLEEMLGKSNIEKLKTELGSKLNIKIKYKDYKMSGKYESGFGQSIEVIEVIDIGDFQLN